MSTSHPVARFTLYRIGLFGVVLAAVWGLGLLGVIPVAGKWGAIVLVVIATMVSGALSIVVLDRQRDAVSTALYNRVEAAKARIDADGEAEDAALDAAAARAAEDGSPA